MLIYVALFKNRVQLAGFICQIKTGFNFSVISLFMSLALSDYKQKN